MASELHQQVSLMLDRERGALAEAITARQYELQPELIARYGAAGRARCLQDASYHLSYLSESVAATAPGLFADYVAWARVMLETRGVPAADLARNLEVMRGILQQQLAPELAAGGNGRHSKVHGVLAG